MGGGRRGDPEDTCSGLLQPPGTSAGGGPGSLNVPPTAGRLHPRQQRPRPEQFSLLLRFPSRGHSGHSGALRREAGAPNGGIKMRLGELTGPVCLRAAGKIHSQGIF